MPVVFNDNSAQVLRDLESRQRACLEACGQQAATYAKQTVAANRQQHTGGLMNITHAVQGKTVDIGTNTSYAIYHEMGTGRYIAGGRKSPWAYQDAEGEWHWTHGVPPLHMIKNAVANHVNTFRQIIIRIMRA